MPAAADAGTYEFRHALLRETAYSEVLPGERQPLHAALARELQDHPELAAGDSGLSAELAHHWHAAGEPELALTASVRAGEQAERVYAHPEALLHYQRALELCGRVTPAARARVDEVAISQAGARVADATGEHRLAIALARRAIELVDARREPVRAGVLHSALGRYLWEAGHSDEARPVAAPQSSRCRGNRLRTRAVWSCRLACCCSAAGRAKRSNRLRRRSQSPAKLGLQEIEAAAMTSQVIALHGHVREAADAGRAALRAAQEAGEPETLLRAYINAGVALEQAGDLQGAIDLALEGVEAARRTGAERGVGAHLKGNVAVRLVKLGRLEAAALVDDALRATPSGTDAAGLYQAAATIAALRGNGPGTDASVAKARAEASEAGAGMWGAGAEAAGAQLQLWRDNAGQAFAIVSRALEQIEGSEYALYSAPLYALGAWAQADLALRARASGRDAEVAQARVAAAELGARLEAHFPAGNTPPEPAGYCAQIEAELGRLEDASDAAAWEEARRQWQVLGFPFHGAVCAWREAEGLLGREGDRERATDLLAAALLDAQALGATPLAAEVEGLARRARIALPGREQESASAADAGRVAMEETGLTPRELDVLRLVADGRTNREIGAELFISEKTVSVHVSRILAKLGAANRAQAATVAHRLGLSTPSG